MDEVKHIVKDIANQWEEFAKNHKIQEDRLITLENKFNNLNKENKNMGNFENIDFTANLETKSSFAEFARSDAINLEKKSLSSDVNEDGGFAVTPELYKEIITKITNISPIRKLASKATISSNVLELLLQDRNFEAGWVAERQEREETRSAKLKQKRIHVHEIFAQPKATQRLLSDSYVNIEEWIMSQIVESFAMTENQAFLHGDGDSKPFGILNCDEIEKISVLEEGSISADDIINLINNLDEPYQQNASFLMNRRTLAVLQSIKDRDGRFIWQNAISDSMPNRLFGVPVYCAAEMPVLGENNLVIAYGNFEKAYKIVDRQDISVMRDPFTEKPFVKFYATKRVGGDVIDPAALKILKS